MITSQPNLPDYCPAWAAYLETWVGDAAVRHLARGFAAAGQPTARPIPDAAPDYTPGELITALRAEATAFERGKDETDYGTALLLAKAANALEALAREALASQKERSNG